MVALDALLSKKRQMMNLTRRRGVSPELIGVDLDGANDYGSRGSDLVGNADGKTFTFATWIWIDSISSVYHLYKVGGDGGNFSIEINASRQLVMWGHNAAFTEVFLATVTSPLPAIQTFNHILVSVDLANSGNRHVYINDAAATVTWTTYTNQEIDFTGGAHSIGALNNGTEKFKGRLAGLFLDYTYRDLSNSANRRLFIDSEGFYVAPPTTGILCVPFDDPSEPFRNDGTGGAFTQNGVIARSGRGVNQYNPAASTFDGSADELINSSPALPSNGNEITLSFKIKGGNTSEGGIVNCQNGSSQVRGFRLRRNTGGRIRVQTYDTGGTQIADIVSDTALVADRWYEVDISIDNSTGDNSRSHMLIDGVPDTSTNTVANSNVIGFSAVTKIAVASEHGTIFLNADLSDVYVSAEYIDLSANNPFFDTETNKPKFLGIDGSLPTGSPPLVYLPMRGNDAGNNAGTGGDFTVNSGPYVGGRGPAEYWADCAAYNGSNQYHSRVSALTGIADGKVFSVALAFYQTAGSVQPIFTIQDGAAQRLSIKTEGLEPHDLRFTGVTSGGSAALNATVSGAIAQDAWHIVLASFDMTDTGKRNIYVNGANGSPSYGSYSDAAIELSGANVYLGQESFGATYYFSGKIGFLYFSTEYIDFSQEANRLLFFDCFGYPVDIGADGSLPTGTAPLIYMNSGFHLGTNLGTGGDFTPQNAPTDGGFVRG
jgi:hypothetical protein